MTKREQIYVSDEFYEEFDQLYLEYKLGKLKVPQKYSGKRMTRSLIYLIALESYFTEKHNFKASPIEN
ncbi:hypothetical protein ACT43X_18800 (plasmid) [Acinetobacter baumannii]